MACWHFHQRDCTMVFRVFTSKAWALYLKNEVQACVKMPLSENSGRLHIWGYWLYGSSTCFRIKSNEGILHLWNTLRRGRTLQVHFLSYDFPLVLLQASQAFLQNQHPRTEQSPGVIRDMAGKSFEKCQSFLVTWLNRWPFLLMFLFKTCLCDIGVITGFFSIIQIDQNPTLSLLKSSKCYKDELF